MNIYQATIMEFLLLKIELLSYSQQPRYGNSLRVHQRMNGQRRYVRKTAIHSGVSFSREKEGNPAGCDKMNGP